MGLEGLGANLSRIKVLKAGQEISENYGGLQSGNANSSVGLVRGGLGCLGWFGVTWSGLGLFEVARVVWSGFGLFWVVLRCFGRLEKFGLFWGGSGWLGVALGWFGLAWVVCGGLVWLGWFGLA